MRTTIRPGRPKPRSDAHRLRVRHFLAYHPGQPLTEISRRCGVPHNSVCYVVRRHKWFISTGMRGRGQRGVLFYNNPDAADAPPIPDTPPVLQDLPRYRTPPTVAGGVPRARRAFVGAQQAWLDGLADLPIPQAVAAYVAAQQPIKPAIAAYDLCIALDSVLAVLGRGGYVRTGQGWYTAAKVQALLAGQAAAVWVSEFQDEDD